MTTKVTHIIDITEKIYFAAGFSAVGDPMCLIRSDSWSLSFAISACGLWKFRNKGYRLVGAGPYEHPQAAGGWYAHFLPFAVLWVRHGAADGELDGAFGMAA